MTRLVPKLRRRRDAVDDANPAAVEEGTPGADPAEPAPDGARTHTARIVAADDGVAAEGLTDPVGVPALGDAATVDGAPDDEAPRPATGRRSKLRRRLRYLRQARDLLLRDLGGMVYEVHRTGAGDPGRHEQLVGEKVGRLRTVDAEIRDLSERLGERGGVLVVREPGVGGTCPSCGELHASDARYCSHCGTGVAGAAAEAPEEQLAVLGARERVLGATGVMPASAAGDPAADAASAAGAPGPRPATAAGDPTGGLATVADEPAGGTATAAGADSALETRGAARTADEAGADRPAVVARPADAPADPAAPYRRPTDPAAAREERA